MAQRKVSGQAPEVLTGVFRGVLDTRTPQQQFTGHDMLLNLSCADAAPLLNSFGNGAKVFVAVHKLMSSHNVCTDTREVIAFIAGISTTSVSRSITQLENMDVLRRMRCIRKVGIMLNPHIVRKCKQQYMAAVIAEWQLLTHDKVVQQKLPQEPTQ